MSFSASPQPDSPCNVQRNGPARARLKTEMPFFAGLDLLPVARLHIGLAAFLGLARHGVATLASRLVLRLRRVGRSVLARFRYALARVFLRVARFLRHVRIAFRAGIGRLGVLLADI